MLTGLISTSTPMVSWWQQFIMLVYDTTLPLSYTVSISVTDKWWLIYSVYGSLHVHFTDRTNCPEAIKVIPCVRKTTQEMHARLCLATITRLSWIPVGVGHRRHSITGRICWCQSPDERGLTTRVYALSSRPEVRSMRIWASSQCCLKIFHIQGTDW